MLCQICKKKPASVHMQEIKNGKRSVLHLCLECASKRALPHGEQLMEGLDLADLMKAFEIDMELMQKQDEAQETEKNFAPCPACMWRLEDVRKTGLFGCPDCYSHFKDPVAERLLELNNTTVHTGRLPAYANDLFLVDMASLAKERAEHDALQRRIESLKQDIDGSVRREEYELAAQLRDQLQDLLKKMKCGG